MYFRGTGFKLQQSDIVSAAKVYGLVPADIQAVLAVETNGSGFDAKNRLVILPEPAQFYKRLMPEHREHAVSVGLADRKWGDTPYPSTQDKRYERLQAMMQLDKAAALESVSYGLPQMMGFNARVCGYADSFYLIDSFLNGELNQLHAMLRFIVANGIMDDLRRHDWTGFAKVYNGSGFAKNHYHMKLAKFWKQFNAGDHAESDPLADGLLSIGDRGNAVLELQQLIHSKFGINPGGFDGSFGKLTSQAVQQVQTKLGIKADGIVGKQTGKLLALSWAI